MAGIRLLTLIGAPPMFPGKAHSRTGNETHRGVTMSSAGTGAAEYTAEVFIGGRFERPASDWLPVLDKAAGEAFGRYGNASAAQVGRAVVAARLAQPAWADTDANTRCAV